jgi:hypothetical protein
MPDYRIYLLNAESHIIAVRQADCADDAAALASAAEAIDGHAGAEVWQRARMVGQVLPCLPVPRPDALGTADHWGGPAAPA